MDARARAQDRGAPAQAQGDLHQNHDQVADLLTRSGLTPAEARLLPSMPAHQTLWKIGEYTALVDHPAVGPELDFCDTNKVMRGSAAKSEDLHTR